MSTPSSSSIRGTFRGSPWSISRTSSRHLWAARLTCTRLDRSASISGTESSAKRRTSMSEREDRVRLQHMLDASRQAIGFVQGRRRNDLDGDLQLTLALTRLVQIVGEAAQNVSDAE